MCQIHADGIEDRQRIGIAPFRQLLHFLELFSGCEMLRQRDACGGRELCDRVLREIFAADAEIAGPLIAHGVFVQIDRCKGQLIEPAENISLGVDVTDSFARAHCKAHDAARAKAHIACQCSHVAVVGNDDGYIADLLRSAVIDRFDLLAAFTRDLDKQGGHHRCIADEGAGGGNANAVDARHFGGCGLKSRDDAVKLILGVGAGFRVPDDLL